MKRINLFLSLLAIFAIVVSSCKNEGETLTPPTIKAVESGTNTYLPGDTVLYTVEIATDNGDLTKISTTSAKATVILESTIPANKWDFDKGEFVSGTYSVKVNYAVVIPTTATTGNQISVKFTVTDEKGETNDDVVDITVGSAAPATEVKTINAVALAFNNSTAASCTSAFSLATGTALNAYTGDGTKFDLVFIYNSTTGYSYASPDAAQANYILEINGINYPTNSRHTKFMAIAETNFTSATVEYINGLTVTDALTLSNFGGSGADDVTNGSTFAYQNADGNVVLFKVTHSKVSASSTIDVKYVGNDSGTK